MKRLVCMLLLILTTILCCIPVSAADTAVTQMDIQCIVQSNGSYEMTVTANVYFDGTDTEIRIPVGEDAKSIKMPGYRYGKETVEGGTVLAVRGAAGTTGARTFVVSYKKNADVTVNSDGTQTLNVELVCPLWEWEVEQCRFTVTMPQPFEGNPLFLSGYFGEGILITEERTEQSVSGTIQGELLDMESVSMQLQLPEKYFRSIQLQGETSTVVLVIMGILAVLGLVYWFLTLRNPMRRAASRKLQPDGVFAWEFPYVGGSGAPDPALLIAEWASLGYVTILTDRHGRVTLQKNIPMSNERKPYEIRMFEALFAGGQECAGDTPRCRKTGRIAEKGCRTYWQRRLFSPKSGNPVVTELLAAAIFGLMWFRAMDLVVPPWALRMVLIVPMIPLGFLGGRMLQAGIRGMLQHSPRARLAPAIGILLVSILMNILGADFGITLLGILAQVLAVLAGGRGGKRTEDGIERAAQIRAFRSYLRSVNSHHLQLMLNRDNQYFYNMIHYAEALGMGKRFAKRFANIQLEPCAWLNDGKGRQGTAMDFYKKDYRPLLRRMRGTSGIR